MVYKGAKYLCYLNISRYLGSAATNPNQLIARGISPAAWKDAWSGVSTASIMASKASSLGGRSAYSVAQSAASLTNQSGGNVGFTYE
ncbi:MAG: hypothetical protein ACLRFP_05545 [Alphaproteobacteria bacterium]